MNGMLLTVLCAAFIFAVDLVGVMIPYWIGAKADTVIPYANAFGIGSMLSLGFFHLLPEAVEELDTLVYSFNFHGHVVSGEYVWPLMVLVFILLITLEYGITFGREAEQVLPIHNDTAIKECGYARPDISPFPLLDEPSSGPEICDDRRNPVPLNRSVSLMSLTSFTNPDLYKTQIAETEQSHGRYAIPLSSWVMYLMITLHSITEGFVVGIQDTPLKTVLITLVLSGHKWVEGMVIGIDVMKQKGGYKENKLPLAIFCLGTPLGAIVGGLIPMFLGGTQAQYFVPIACLIAGCSIIFVAFHCVIPETFGTKGGEKRKIGLVFAGAALVLYLTLWEMALEG